MVAVDPSRVWMLLCTTCTLPFAVTVTDFQSVSVTSQTQSSSSDTVQGRAASSAALSHTGGDSDRVTVSHSLNLRPSQCLSVLLLSLSLRVRLSHIIMIVIHSRAVLNDGLFQKRWTSVDNRQSIVTLPSVLSAVCIAQN